MIIRKKKAEYELTLEETHQGKVALGTGAAEQNLTQAPQKHDPKPLDEIQTIKSYEDIDIDLIEFKERSERRRGDRRRGYRRIDERTLVSRAQAEAQNIKELSAKEGYKNGLEEAQKDIGALKAAIGEFLNSKSEVYDYISKDILEIALDVAKKIIKREVSLDNTVLKSVIQEVIDEIDVDEQKVTLNVHPDEITLARSFMPEILAQSQMDAKVIIVGDEDMEKGSCKVTASNGVIDANFSTQLTIIQNAFRSIVS